MSHNGTTIDKGSSTASTAPRHMRPWGRRVLRLGLVGAVTGAAVVVAANVVVVARTTDGVTTDVAELGPAQVVIVPGSHVRDDGSLGSVVAERVEVAVALHRAGTVQKVLVSGDNGTAGYNETDAMREAALAAGVPGEDVFADYAGFSTWHTMSRARDVFGVETAVVVTQSAYVARSVDLGEAAGIDTQGYVVRDGGRRGREVLARVSGLAEATWRPSVVGGPMMPITGDGRASWAVDRPRGAAELLRGDSTGRADQATSEGRCGGQDVDMRWVPITVSIWSFS